MKMFNHFDESKKILIYKYGSQSFFILMFEIILLDILYISIDPINEVYNFLFNKIGIENLLIFVIIIPISYNLIRSLISGCIYSKYKLLYCIYAPVFTLIYLQKIRYILMAIPLLIILWSIFFVNLYLYWNKDDKNKTRKK